MGLKQFIRILRIRQPIMNLIFIYGPPAVGKTTVGRELARLTGYKFFYNHLTVPAAKALFPNSREPHPDPMYTRLLHALRLTSLEVAAAAHLDTIFTIAYSGEVDNPFVAEIVTAFEKNGGHVYFVELHASEEVLMQHVIGPSREALNMGKMTSPEHLQDLLETRDMFRTVPYPNVLKINTGKVKPHEAATQIIRQFNLTP
jgi:DNA polymerase III delta prime subunit